MRIIPVIDILGGVAVRAVGGWRDEYRPLETPLAASSDPRAVAEGFLRLHAFEIIYLADLDAIMRQGADDRALLRLSAAFPKVTFWIDRGGLAPPAAANFMRVIGSESLSPDAPAPDLSKERNAILSLDFDAGGFRGPPELEREPALWPPRIILMTLAKIGGGRGPDCARLSEIKALAGSREVYAAGGLRGAADLAGLAGLGVAGALVATALHEGRVGASELAAYA